MKRLAVVAAAVLSLSASVFAQSAPSPVRGEVTAIAADSVTLKGADGAEAVIGLLPTWTVSVMTPITIDAIKPGSFIGTAEMPQADGTGRSLEVHVFPPGVKLGEGHYAWDLKEGSMMTNGTVGEVTESPDGRTITVTYPNGSRTITVPEGVPIVQIVDGTREQVTAGVKAFVIAFPTPDGKRAAGAIAIGENGAAPPM